MVTRGRGGKQDSAHGRTHDEAHTHTDYLRPTHRHTHTHTHTRARAHTDAVHTQHAHTTAEEKIIIDREKGRGAHREALGGGLRRGALAECPLTTAARPAIAKAVLKETHLLPPTHEA